MTTGTGDDILSMEIAMTREEIEAFIKENEPHPLHDYARSHSLEDFLDVQRNKGFSDLLLKFIRESGMTEVECYKAAGITAQHFSKIRSKCCPMATYYSAASKYPN